MDQCKDCDLYGAGFPCQDYSQLSVSRTGPQSHRGQYYQLCIKRIKWLKPKRFILENVPTFGTYDNGRLLEELRKELQTIGYKVYCKVLDAFNFQVPPNPKAFIHCWNSIGFGSRRFPFPNWHWDNNFGHRSGPTVCRG